MSNSSATDQKTRLIVAAAGSKRAKKAKNILEKAFQRRRYEAGIAAMKRWVPAPSSDPRPYNGQVLGVLLNAGEKVQWAYTILPDGRRIVTGYDIIFPQPTRPAKKKRCRSARK